jgi:hypothetical protein
MSGLRLCECGFGMDFLDKQIAPPKSWQTFEDLMRALFASVWENPLTQKNGRTGQPQHGVDVYGEPSDQGGSWHGVQCKGKDAGYEAKATRSEFDSELEKAEEFKPTLSRWIFVTTAPNDAALQEHAREVSSTRQAAGKFPVEIVGWDSLQALIAGHPAVLRQFYPEHVSPVPDELASLDQASTTALDAIDDALRHGQASVTLLRPESWEALKGAISTHPVVRLVGEGGAGKSGLLRRLGKTSAARVLVIKDNRTTGVTIQQHLTQLGIMSSIETLLAEFPGSGEALCLIDGADRLLLSERRGVVLDLFRAIASHPARERWRIVTTARTFQQLDPVAAALTEAGIDTHGQRIDVGAIDDEDVAILSAAFPAFSPLLRRGDLASQNRSLFLLRELLRSEQAPLHPPTEIDLAAAWATADVADGERSARRSKALSELGRHLIAAPWQWPALADIDPIGLQQLIEEGTAFIVPRRDAIALAHDVHEDWLIARSLHTLQSDLPSVLQRAREPLWWQRGVRLTAQMILEEGDPSGWMGLLAALDADKDLDPAWSRAILVAPFYSERSGDILPTLAEPLLADGTKLLARILETLLVFETRIDEALLQSPALAEMSETDRYTLAGYWKMPVWRSWGAFLRWSLPHWATWPPELIPRLSELAAVFARATSRLPNGFSQNMATIIEAWLHEIEDARSYGRWDERREPFGLNLEHHRAWNQIEKRLRESLADTVESASRTVGSYLTRLADLPELHEARAQLLENPARVPKALPSAWTDMCLMQFLERRRARRRDRDDPFRYQLFSWHDYHEAGIQGDQGFFPSSPLRGGFADLFESDEREAFRLFHRLEMRASVFWRWYNKCENRKRARALKLSMPWGTLSLWGDEPVYRWSRGLLGSHVLGSAYLALDDWLSSQAAKGRPIGELLQLVLQDNGLIATAAPCIAVLAEHINSDGAIDWAGPFLGEPRLWDYDIRRHIDDQGFAHRIGFFSGDNLHYQAVERLHQRHSSRLPLSHTLLLPFRLKAGEIAQKQFDERRSGWAAADLAEFEAELEDQPLMAEHEERIARCLSDSDPKQIVFDQIDEGIQISIAPPAEAEAEIAALAARQQFMNRAARLANWVNSTREGREVSSELSLEEAISLASELVEEFPASDDTDFNFVRRMAGSGIVGTAAATSVHGSAELVESHLDWIEQWLRAGAALRRDAVETQLTVDEAVLPYDAQVMAAWGLAALASRGLGSNDVDGLVLALTVQRLHAVTEASLDGLDWSVRPEFARNVYVAALDSCVFEAGRWWKGETERRRAAERTAKLRAKAVKRALRADQGARTPILPPAPYAVQWIWTGKWSRPLRRMMQLATRALDWNKAGVVLKRIDWQIMGSSEVERRAWGEYLGGLVEWTRAYSEEEERRSDSHFPYEWGHRLARVLGRFAAQHGRAGDWERLAQFTYRDRAAELVGEYLGAIAEELVESGRAPDDRFWASWTPAAEWLLQEAIPRERGYYDSLSYPARAVGLLGPYQTPIPPGWPHLEAVLPWIDRWVRLTAHLPAAAYAVLPVVEMMDDEQRARWFLPWLELFAEKHGPDEGYWSHNGLGNKAAALLMPLSTREMEMRNRCRQCLGIIADAGSTVARELLPSFANQRSG